MTVPNAVSERHLIALWASVRDALTSVETGHLDALAKNPELAGVLAALAKDARVLSDALQGRLQTPPARNVERPRGADERPHVLVVDSSKESAEALTRLLRRDFHVTATSMATEAVKLTRERVCDAVVASLRMPGVDGLALLDLLRVTLSPAPPLLLVAEATDARHRHSALERGAFDFLVRPLDCQELLATLSSAVLHGQELQREHALQLTDDLTGLLNRRALNLALRDALANRAEHHAPLALALVDQDGLKQLNDRHGHAAGDRAIVAIARALSSVRRSSDVVVRQGGDEFAVLMPNTTVEGARRMLERAQAELEHHPLELGGGATVPLRISFGVASCTASVTRAEELLAAADAALYAMKRQKAA
jgi:diguanylate cyclase (GGDEF)-like protein